MNVRRIVALAALALVVLWPVSALAHGELESTDPAEGAKLDKAPKSVSVTLTEEPTNDATFEVVDGCGDVVSGAPKISEATISAAIADAQPGKWKASFKAVSAEDGHVTEDDFHFTVEGKKDCSAGDDNGGKNKGKNDGSNDGSGSPTSARDDDGSSFPIVPVVIGTLVLVALAALIRARSAS